MICATCSTPLRYSTEAKVWMFDCGCEPPFIVDTPLNAAAPDLLAASKEAENALLDYIPTIEKTGASLNYGRSVLAQLRAAIAKAEGR